MKKQFDYRDKNESRRRKVQTFCESAKCTEDDLKKMALQLAADCRPDLKSYYPIIDWFLDTYEAQRIMNGGIAS